jgi:hypothetical protein
MVLTLEVILDEFDECSKKCDSYVKPNRDYMNEYFNLRRKRRKLSRYSANMSRRKRCLLRRCKKETRRLYSKFPGTRMNP